MEKWRYGVILDAGSSGTRAHIYRWLHNSIARKQADKKALHSLPKLETSKKWTKKIKPGISTYGEKPNDVGEKYLKELFDHTLKQIPDDAVADTPIYLLATAGMRLLPESQKQKLLAEICSYAKSHTKFQITSCESNFQIIPGETEGLYGWLAANYLLGGFDAPAEHDHGKGHHTYGFLDMGGASAQIAFAPNSTEAERHAEDLKMMRLRDISGKSTEYQIFVTTFLGYGANEARRRYVESLLDISGSNDSQELEDPCLPVGLRINTKGDVLLPGSTVKGKTHSLIGTGQFDKCLKRTFPLIDKNAPCHDEPCLFNGTHVPAIDFDVNHFVGVSEYWHTTHEVFEMGHSDKAYDFNTYQHRVSEFCSKDWKQIKAGLEKHEFGKKVDERIAVEVCFKASWLINLLHDGIGIPRVGLEHTGKDSGHNGTKEVINGAKEKGYTSSFQAVDKIDGTEVSWTLGKMLLYASSQIPSKEPNLPVGFGNNTLGPGLPANFEYGGPRPLAQLCPHIFPLDPSPSSSKLESDPYADPSLPGPTDSTDWHDTLFQSRSPRRIPGLILILIILAFAIFLLCGRDRRSRLYRKLGGSGTSPTRYKPPRPSGFLGVGGKVGRIFGSGRNGQAYERVMEDGRADGVDMELGDLEADSEGSDSSGLGLGISAGGAGLLGSQSRERLVGMGMGMGGEGGRVSRRGVRRG
ncbi:Golgi apyrase [Physcia stellaris]|nr:Golgi apyrase [Physcia stellaris]